jgi:hypothetical protein
VRRIVKVLAVAVLVATVLVIFSTTAFARPLRGGLPQQNERLCEMLAGNHPRFAETAPEPPGPGTENPTATCWHVSPGLGRASDVVPPFTRFVGP